MTPEVDSVDSYSTEVRWEEVARPLQPDTRTSSKTSSPIKCCRRSSEGTEGREKVSVSLSKHLLFYQMDSMRPVVKPKIHKTAAGLQDSSGAKLGSVPQSCPLACPGEQGRPETTDPEHRWVLKIAPK